MKCPNCGNETFKTVETHDICILRTSGEITQVAIAYACEKCGRIELYMPESWIRQNIDAKKIDEDKKNFYAEKTERIKKLKMKIDNLKEIINDENQTVKAVREANEKITELEKELANAQTSSFDKTPR